MIIQDYQTHLFRGRHHRRYLGQDVDAVLVFVDHFLKAAHLTFDTAKSGEKFFLIFIVCAQTYFPDGDD